MTPYQQKLIAVVVSALTAAAVSFLTGYSALIVTGHESALGVKILVVGALLAFVKDIHSFTSTAPKDVADSSSASGS